MIITDRETEIKNKVNYVVDSYVQTLDTSIYTLTYKLNSTKLILPDNVTKSFVITYEEKWYEESDGTITLIQTPKAIAKEEVI